MPAGAHEYNRVMVREPFDRLGEANSFDKEPDRPIRWMGVKESAYTRKKGQQASGRGHLSTQPLS